MVNLKLGFAKNNLTLNTMKKLLLILLCLPMIGFGQDDCGDKPLYKGNKFGQYKTTKKYKDYKKKYDAWLDCKGGNFGDCKFSRNEVDDMTGTFVAETQSKMLFYVFGGDKIYFNFKNIDGNYYLNLDISRHSRFSISEGNSLLIKLSNDEIIDLKFLHTEVSRLEYYSQYISTYSLSNVVSLTKENLTKLTNNKITKIRVYGNDGYFENEKLKEKGINNFLTNANCIKDIKIKEKAEPSNKF